MSPYENRLNAEDFRRIALIAEIAPDRQANLRAILQAQPETLRADCAEVGICHLHLYTEQIESRVVIFVYFESEQLDQDSAASDLKSSSPWWGEVEACLLPHPRASATDAPWQRAEFINVIAGNTARDRVIGEPMGLVAGMIPSKELWYRTLHQTNWPGVIDQMARSHHQNWTTFMIEWGTDLLLFTHVEYLGTDKSKDAAAMAADPITQRWWTHTEPCLKSIHESGNTWAQMARC
ncbi:MAG: L-rhamnose mutarotase [Opitutaceae bacterium]